MILSILLAIYLIGAFITWKIDSRSNAQQENTDDLKITLLGFALWPFLWLAVLIGYVIYKYKYDQE